MGHSNSKTNKQSNNKVHATNVALHTNTRQVYASGGPAEIQRTPLPVPPLAAALTPSYQAAGAIHKADAPAVAHNRADSGLDGGDLINGKWLLLQRIGRGAFGDIFIAECIAESDTNNFGRRVAMKVERLEAAEPLAAPTSQAQQVNSLQLPTAQHDNAAPSVPASPPIAADKSSAAVQPLSPTPLSPVIPSPPSSKRCIIKLEAVVLSKLQRHECVSRFIEYGRDNTLSVAYLAMELLGENLLKLRRQRKNGKFTIATTLRLGIQAIKAIRAMHECGFIHRDIKPSNFVTGIASEEALELLNGPLTSNSHNVYMIDFGLARAYRDRTSGHIIPARIDVGGFRGTPRYASIFVHREQDLCRRDDLWSLLYILVEFITGDLPWGNKRDKSIIGNLKEQYFNQKLLKGCPSCFIPFLKHLMNLTFTDTPDYEYLISLLEGKLKKLRVKESDLMDWEERRLVPSHETLSHARAAAAAVSSPTPTSAFVPEVSPMAAELLSLRNKKVSNADEKSQITNATTPHIQANDVTPLTKPQMVVTPLTIPLPSVHTPVVAYEEKEKAVDSGDDVVRYHSDSPRDNDDDQPGQRSSLSPMDSPDTQARSAFQRPPYLDIVEPPTPSTSMPPQSPLLSMSSAIQSLSLKDPPPSPSVSHSHLSSALASLSYSPYPTNQQTTFFTGGMPMPSPTHSYTLQANHAKLTHSTSLSALTLGLPAIVASSDDGNVHLSNLVPTSYAMPSSPSYAMTAVGIGARGAVYDTSETVFSVRVDGATPTATLSPTNASKYERNRPSNLVINQRPSTASSSDNNHH